MRIVVLAPIALCLTGCFLHGESSQLAEQIARERATLLELDAQIQELAETLPNDSGDLIMRVNRPALEAIVAAVNAAPNRMVTLSSVGSKGQIARDGWRTLLGHAGWYIELKEGAGKLRGRVTLGKFTVRSADAGLSVGVPVSARLEADTRGHYDPGPGGGFELSPIDFSATTEGTLTATASASSSKGGLALKVAVSAPAALPASVTVRALKLGRKTFDMKVRTAGLTLLEQPVIDDSGLEGLLRLSGLGLADRRYRLQIKDAAVTSDLDGIAVSARLQATWQ